MDVSEENDINEKQLAVSAEVVMKADMGTVKAESKTVKKEVEADVDTDLMENNENVNDMVETPTSSMSFYMLL